MHIPLLGRLLLYASPHFLNLTYPLSRPEYGALIVGLLLLIFEAVARIVTILLPNTVVEWLYQKTRSAFHAFARSPYKHEDPVRVKAERIRTAKDFEELCSVYGYTPEEHLVQTKDGYLLVVHRLPSRKGEARARPGTPTGKPVVYLHHGRLREPCGMCN